MTARPDLRAHCPTSTSTGRPQQPEKHEYIAGETFNMAGRLRRRITGSAFEVLTVLERLLDDRECASVPLRSKGSRSGERAVFLPGRLGGVRAEHRRARVRSETLSRFSKCFPTAPIMPTGARNGVTTASFPRSGTTPFELSQAEPLAEQLLANVGGAGDLALRRAVEARKPSSNLDALGIELKLGELYRRLL